MLYLTLFLTRDLTWESIRDISRSLSSMLGSVEVGGTTLAALLTSFPILQWHSTVVFQMGRCKHNILNTENFHNLESTGAKKCLRLQNRPVA